MKTPSDFSLQTLDLFAPPPAAPDTAWLESILLNAGGWLNAAFLAKLATNHVSDRDIRRLASASRLIIPGDKGYCHLANASTEEIDHAASRLESQGKLMLERAIRIRHTAHARLG